MDNLNRAYRKAIRSELDFQENWQPTRTWDIGTVYYVDKGGLVRLHSLNDLGIAVETSSVASKAFVFTYGRGTQYSIEAGAKAEQISTKGKIKFQFGSGNGVFVSAADCSTESISNKATVLEAIIKCAHNNKWEKEWVFVDEVIRAKKLNVIISKEGGVEVEAECQTELPQIALEDASLTLSIKHVKGGVYQCIDAKNAVPCFRGLYLHKKFWSGERKLRVHKFGQARDDEDESDGEDFTTDDFVEFRLDD